GSMGNDWKYPLRSLRSTRTGFLDVQLCIAYGVLGLKEEIGGMEQKNKGKKKEVVYQVFTRLFGNTNTTNKPWGTLAENGVGKFSDFTEKALQEIKDLGVTYIWYT